MIKLMIIRHLNIIKTCRLEEYVERTKYQYTIFFDFETITSECKHMPYLCWIYNDDIQQEFIGIHTCAVDMLNALPIDRKEIFPIRLKQPIITLNLFTDYSNLL